MLLEGLISMLPALILAMPALTILVLYLRERTTGFLNTAIRDNHSNYRLFNSIPFDLLKWLSASLLGMSGLTWLLSSYGIGAIRPLQPIFFGAFSVTVCLLAVGMVHRRFQKLLQLLEGRYLYAPHGYPLCQHGQNYRLVYLPPNHEEADLCRATTDDDPDVIYLYRLMQRDSSARSSVEFSEKEVVASDGLLQLVGIAPTKLLEDANELFKRRAQELVGRLGRRRRLLVQTWIKLCLKLPLYSVSAHMDKPITAQEMYNILRSEEPDLAHFGTKWYFFAIMVSKETIARSTLHIYRLLNHLIVIALAAAIYVGIYASVFLDKLNWFGILIAALNAILFGTVIASTTAFAFTAYLIFLYGKVLTLDRLEPRYSRLGDPLFDAMSSTSTMICGCTAMALGLGLTYCFRADPPNFLTYVVASIVALVVFSMAMSGTHRARMNTKTHLLRKILSDADEEETSPQMLQRYNVQLTALNTLGAFQPSRLLRIAPAAVPLLLRELSKLFTL